MSDESIKPSTTSNNSLPPSLHFISTKIQVKFDGSSLKQDKFTFNCNTAATFYIVHEINWWPFKHSSDFTLKTFYLELLS